MAWNIGLLSIQADPGEAEQLLDVFYKSSEGLYFEDVTSVMMGSALGVAHAKPWLLILDTEGRFIYQPEFALEAVP
ncbi:hypothetical protein DCC85_05675 [Paenibacillus sp. CAA11]|uniref:hypothetical protein n=1 Tax=Paenibacillus sp. CAA11 TaxID=1532905 RepID=UPI000D38620F|nr:hypothetical protein [Paenibacillus sp. CAA11]AWB43760.1 hypothetical protein DCC85_05675 [Paenibacillus sp. CAA11]